MRVKLKEKWSGFPAESYVDTSDRRGQYLIDNGIAYGEKTKPKKKKAVKKKTAEK